MAAIRAHKTEYSHKAKGVASGLLLCSQRAAFPTCEWCCYCKAAASTCMRGVDPKSRGVPKRYDVHMTPSDPQTQTCKLAPAASPRANRMFDNSDQQREDSCMKDIVVRRSLR